MNELKWRIGLFFLLIASPFFKPEAADALDQESNRKKIALLFLTYELPNHTDLWQEYLLPHMDLFNIYIHPKSSIHDPFFAQFTIPAYYETSWHNTIAAEKGLLTEAFANEENFKFVLLTDSCIPLVNAEALYDTLVKDEESYFYWTQRGWWDPTDPREINELPQEHRTGNYQQFVLNRRHAEICVQDKHILNIVKKHPNDQESYPSCLFSVHGCLNEVVNFNYTYVDWTRATPDRCHPYTFSSNNDHDFKILLKAKRSGHLFARKIAPEFPEKAIKDLIKMNYTQTISKFGF